MKNDLLEKFIKDNKIIERNFKIAKNGIFYHLVDDVGASMLLVNMVDSANTVEVVFHDYDKRKYHYNGKNWLVIK